MPRKNNNARPVRKGVEKRGRHRDHAPLYVRWCDECGLYEASFQAGFLSAYRECPRCSGQLAA
jgi:predicted nucleic acid-binding Zn ribbon protein